MKVKHERKCWNFTFLLLTQAYSLLKQTIVFQYGKQNFLRKFFVCYSHVMAKDSKLLFLILINVLFITFLSVAKQQNIKLNPIIIASANFPGVNAPVMADFRLAISSC